MQSVAISPDIMETGSMASGGGHLGLNSRSNNLKHYTENARLQEVFNLYSTLEERPLAEEVQENNDAETQIVQGGINDMRSQTDQASSNNGLQNIRIIDRLRRFLIGRLFKINHVILDNQAITPFIYHLILLFEFAQALFFIFAGVNVVNNFIQSTSVTTSTTSNSDNSTSSQNSTVTIQVIDPFSTDLSIIQLEQYFLFANFPLYPLKDRSTDQFIAMYGVFIGIFYGMVGIMYALADNLYSAQKKQELKDGSKMVIKALSLIITAYMTILQIPLLMLCLQGYLCGEDPDDYYILEEYTCGSSFNQILSVVSSLTILIYLAFQLVQQLIYTSGNFETNIPWGSLDRNVTIIRVTLKLLIVFSFMLDKFGRYRNYTHIACASLGFILVYKRIISGLIFIKSIYYATVIYEFLVSWLFLNIAIHQIRAVEISNSSILLTSIAGILIVGASLLIQETTSKATMVKAFTRRPDQISFTQNALQAEQHLYRFLQMISSDEPGDHIILMGIITNHLDNCKDFKCECQFIFQESGIKFQKLLIQQWQSDYSENILKKSHTMRSRTSKNVCIDQIQNIQQNKIEIDSTIKLEKQHENKNQLKQAASMDLLEVIQPNVLNKSLTQVSADPNIISQKHLLLPMNQKNHEPSKLSLPSHLGKTSIGKLNDVHQRQPSLRSLGTVKKDSEYNRQISAQKPLNRGDTTNSAVAESVKIGQTFEEGELEQIGNYIDNLDKEIISGESIDELENKMMFKFLSLLIDQSIKQFPKSIELRIHSSYIQSAKLMNEFKAIFQLMKGDKSEPSIYNKFFIFRRRIFIERIVITKNQQNFAQGGRVNAFEAYTYEKLYSRFQKLNYIAANSALAFWRELLQRNINANVLTERGAAISNCYEKIQDIAANILKISPNDIKFLQLYATFLKQIANNEQEAQVQYEKAQQIFSRILTNKNRQGKSASINDNNSSDQNYQQNEDILFGENSASGILMLSLEAENVGRMLHANDEVKRILGYTKKDLIGKKVNTIQPYPIACIHDRIMRRFLDTARRTVLNHQIDLFAINKEGYLQPINMLLKLYPQMSDRIVIMGWFQNLERLDRMFQNKYLDERSLTLTDQIPHNYIIADGQGRIYCVTEGLANEVGLNSKFFSTDESFATSIMIEDIFESQIKDPDFKEDLEGSGLELTLHTHNILEKVNIELLSHEEIQYVRSTVGTYYTHVQLLPLIFEDFNTTINLYKIVILPKIRKEPLHSGTNLGASQPIKVGGMIGSGLSSKLSGSEAYYGKNQSMDYEVNTGGLIQGDMASQISSTSSNDINVTYSKLLADFKSAIDRRDTPSHLVLLNRVLTVIFLLAIVMSGVDYSMKRTFLVDAANYGKQMVRIESRLIKFIQIQSHLRSFVNIANGVEFGTYSEVNLKRIDRFQYLKQMIQTEALLLQEVQDLMQQERNSEDIAHFEQQKVSIFRLSSQDRIDSTRLPFRVAFNSYLNSLLSLNVTTREELAMPDFLIRGSPKLQNNLIFNGTTTNNTLTLSNNLQKELYSMLTNGLRILWQRAEESNQFLYTLLIGVSSTDGLSSFLSMMLIGIFVSAFSLILIIYQIIHNEWNKVEIISIFALLSPEDVKKVYDVCDQYIDRFEQDEPEIDEINPRILDKPIDIIVSGSKDMTALSDFHQTNDQLLVNLKNGPGVSISSGSKFRRGSRAPKQALEFINSEEQKDDQQFQQESSNNSEQFLQPQMRKKNMFQINTQQEHYSQMLKKSLRILKADHLSQKDMLAKPIVEKTEMIELKNRSMKSIMGIKNKFNKSTKNTKSKKSQEINVVTGKRRTTRIDILSSTKKSIFESSTSGLNLQEIKEENNKSNSSSDNEDTFEIEQQKKAIKDAKLASLIAEQKESEENSDVQQRKQMLHRTSTGKRGMCKNMIMINCAVSLVYFTFFTYVYTYHKEQLEIIKVIEETTPIFFDRYSDMIASYAFLRERIINNNTNTYDLGFYSMSYTHDSLANQSIDWYYHTKSMTNEREIAKLKVQRPAAIQTLLDHATEMDSDNFCNALFGIVKGAAEEKVKITKNAEIKLMKIRAEAYQDKLDTVIAACNYASAGDLENLKIVAEKGVNLNLGDYDNRTPLHVSCGAGHASVVEYLLAWGVIVNPVDRWGATPVNDAIPFPPIYKMLMDKGAIKGKTQPSYVPFSVTVTEDQFRLYYAAFYNNVVIMDGLRLLGWQVDGQDYDGRTALGVAASSGSLDAVKYLVSKGADLSIRDSRGNDPLDDAKRENRTAVINYLINEALVRNFCGQFEDGLFNRGLQYAVGIFQKKFADLQNTVSSTTSHPQLLGLLGGTRFNATIQTQATMRTFEVFLSTCELFLNKVINKLTEEVQLTYDKFNVSYQQIADIAFFSFLAFQLLCLFFLKGRLLRTMSEDVMKSRGILNLVPESFFKNHSHAVEKVIKTLKM